MTNKEYPRHWWTAAPETDKPYWEVLPQEARPGEVILSKRNDLGILSNFTHTPFVFRGKRYESIEGFWQMMFYPENEEDPRTQMSREAGLTWPHTREAVSQMIAFEAQLAGEAGFANMKAMGIDWVTFEGRRMDYWTPHKADHYELVIEAMRAKLEQNPRVRETLLATGDLELRPDHFQPADAPPSWKYNRIWMEIRGELSRMTN